MLVGHCEDQYVGSVKRVNHTVGKALEAATANFGGEWMPCLWALLNKVQHFECFQQKRVLQAWWLVRIPTALRRFVWNLTAIIDSSRGVYLMGGLWNERGY